MNQNCHRCIWNLTLRLGNSVSRPVDFFYRLGSCTVSLMVKKRDLVCKSKQLCRPFWIKLSSKRESNFDLEWKSPVNCWWSCDGDIVFSLDFLSHPFFDYLFAERRKHIGRWSDQFDHLH